MRRPDCIIVRVGEQALKSPRTQRKWWRILLDNMRATLQAQNIEFKFESSPNRVFVYTKELKEAEKALKRIFGITSFSPAWTCFSGLDELRLLATDIAVDVLKLKKDRSFAIRVYRAGRHPFTSRAVAEEVGAAVKRVTGAKVNLSKPDFEIEIEVRSRKSYIFLERVAGPGGLPVGTAGKVIAVISDKNSAVAAWLIARRGAQLCLLVKRGEKWVEKLKRWHYGKKMPVYKNEKLCNIVEKEKTRVIVTGESVEESLRKKIKELGLLHLRPLVALNKSHINKLARKVKN